MWAYWNSPKYHKTCSDKVWITVKFQNLNPFSWNHYWIIAFYLHLPQFISDSTPLCLRRPISFPRTASIYKSDRGMCFMTSLLRCQTQIFTPKHSTLLHVECMNQFVSKHMRRRPQFSRHKNRLQFTPLRIKKILLRQNEPTFTGESRFSWKEFL